MLVNTNTYWLLLILLYDEMEASHIPISITETVHIQVMTAQSQILAIFPFLLEGSLELFLKFCCQKQT